MRFRTFSLVCLASALTAPGVVHAQAGETLSALLIDESLAPRKVRLVAFEGNELVFFDHFGAERRIGIDRLTAIVAIDPAADVADGIGAGSTPGMDTAEIGQTNRTDRDGYLELVDGQQFPGDLLPAVSEEEIVTWQHARFGEMRVSLDVVGGFFRSNQRATRAVRENLPVEDELYLVNGDVLRGFLAGLGDPVKFETEGQIVELEPRRVAGAQLANPRTSVSGLVVWLNDGTVASLDSIVSRRDRDVVLTLSEGQAGVYDITDLRGVAFDADRIRPLADIEPTAQSPVGNRLFVDPIRRLRHPDAALELVEALNTSDVLMPGPMEVTWQLPPNAERLAGTASLVYGTAPWGDCELVIHIDGVEHFRTRLGADAPVAPFNLLLDGAELTITVEPGKFGPIHDRVILHRPIILMPQGGA